MSVIALCGSSWKRQVRKGAGVVPFASPPLTISEPDPLIKMLNQARAADIFLMKLHGKEDDPIYYGSDWTEALSASYVEQFDWSGVVVFAEVCYAGGPSPENSKIRNAFLRCGAKAFIGCAGPVFARTRHTILDGEADLLAKQFIRQYSKEDSAHLAFYLALARFIFLSLPLDEDDKATVRDFRIFGGEL